MITTPDALLIALREHGLLDTPAAGLAAAAPRPTADERPWFIGALLGASGWLAGLCVLGFVGLLFRPTSPAAAGLAGAVLLGAAWGLYKADREGAFVAQLALALSIAGQCLVLYAMTGPMHSFAPIATAAFALQVALALLMPNPLHRTLSTWFAAIAWGVAVRSHLVGDPGLFGASSRGVTSLPMALAAWCVAWFPVAGLLLALIRTEPRWMAQGWQGVCRPVAAGLIVGLASATLVSQPFESLRGLVGGAAAQDWAALWPALSALGALAGLAAAFALGHRGLVGLCGVAALLHVAHFYYALGTSLRMKSMLMLLTAGAMLFAANRLAARRPTPGAHA